MHPSVGVFDNLFDSQSLPDGEAQCQAHIHTAIMQCNCTFFSVTPFDRLKKTIRTPNCQECVLLEDTSAGWVIAKTEA